MPIEQFCSFCRKCDDRDKFRGAKIAEAVKNSAYHIIDYKGQLGLPSAWP